MKLQVLYYKIIAASLMMAAMGWFSDVVWAQKNYNAIRINAKMKIIYRCSYVGL